MLAQSGFLCLDAATSLPGQLAETMKLQNVSKKALAERMQTSRTAVDRALDQNDAGMTLATLASAARALGQRMEVRLMPERGSDPL
jgi:DNA-binding phage protein